MSALRRGVGVLLLAASAVTWTSTAPAGASSTTPTSSQVVARGSGPFASLAVTVTQTRHLVNQVVSVTWSGGTPTRGSFATDYLQVMQCWGDDPAGPRRDQCQFGGLTGDPRGGGQVASRQVTYDIKDPAESLTPTADKRIRYVPFTSVSGKTTESGVSEFFDRNTTNEVPFARTGSDGTGFTPFEVQTGVEAPGLGCGQPVSDTATAGITGRGCWLVVVPRNDKEVDGSTRTDDASHQLISSPLSASNWAHRLVVPLQFAPIGQPCQLGKAERGMVGQEAGVEALSSYQPVLCRQSADAPVFSLSQVPDAIARRQALSDSPGLPLTSRPVPRAQVPPGRVLRYAPFALSGMTVAFDIETQPAYNAPASVQAQSGRRIHDLQLTPRLVAKLLTQSYQRAAARDRPGLEKNPVDLTRDPEFLALNPAFRTLSYAGIADIIVPAGNADTFALVWQWILADNDAKAFLAGTADAWGMVINPAYKGLTPTDTFPKADRVCQTFTSGQPPLCTLDAHPYAADGHEAARAAARGDSLSRSFYDTTALPPVYKKQAPQLSGSRALLALCDTATAARYGLDTARLRNASGAFVAPDQTGMLAGLAAMRPSPDAQVLLPNPAAPSAAAYPLSTVTYAIAVPGALTPPAGRDFAALLRYATGPGQTSGVEPGQLPPGYAPLPPAQRASALAVATALTHAGPVAAPAVGPEAAVPAVAAAAPAGPPMVPLSAPVTPSSVGTAPVLPGLSTGAAGAAAPARPVAVQLSAGGVTELQPVGLARYAVVLALALGGLAALAGTGLRRTTGRLRRTG